MKQIFLAGTLGLSLIIALLLLTGHSGMASRFANILFIYLITISLSLLLQNYEK